MDKERFTMLLLEPGEIFFEDYSVLMKSISNGTCNETEWIDGRLKLCSKSLVFVHKDLNKPLIKIQLTKALTVEPSKSTEWHSRGNEVLSVKCEQYVEMLQGNVLAPYKFISKRQEYLFWFNYATVQDCLPQISQLLRAAALMPAEQNAMIRAIVHSRQSRISFDTSWLEDLYEKVVLEVQADKITPLVVNPGRVLLTSSRIYFQPYNNMEQHPVLKFQLKDVQQIIKRRFLLKQVGIELQCDTKKSTNERKEFLFLSLRSENDRDNLYDSLFRQTGICPETVQRNQMTMQWQNGSLSNYDYLLFINSLADRTFHDLTQYPVFPWVVQDYVSDHLDLDDPKSFRDLTKPIGALNPIKFQRLKERYSEMGEPKFLYGSHYSAPGFVLFYLVRKYPQYMLCLQNGKFDHPNRMFNSVADVWKNVLMNMSDFKELIPEFYDVETAGSFLVNHYGIDFGCRDDGLKVGDVQLPPWAKDPADFVSQMRDALESDYVSKNLHHWIDLIFGYKQRGVEAEEACNLFHYVGYEGAVDLDTIQDINDRHAMEVQIMEFGQIPKQVFAVPHPRKIVLKAQDTREDSPSDGTRVNQEKSARITQLRQSMTFQSHKDAVSCVIVNIGESTDNVISVGCDGMLKLYSTQTRKSTRSVALSTLPLSSCISYTTATKSNILVAGCWDNTLIFYDVEFGRIFDTLHAHEDAISCLAWSPTRKILVSGSWDCTAKVWRAHGSAKMKPAECLIAQLEHDAKITCIVVSSDEKLLASGTEDGEIFLWCVEKFSLQYNVTGHESTVNAASFDPDSKKLATCSMDRKLKVIDIRTGMQIYCSLLDDEPKCLLWSGSLLLVGDIRGYLHLWDMHGVIPLSKFSGHSGAITSIAVSNDKKTFFTGSEDKKVAVWEVV